MVVCLLAVASGQPSRADTRLQVQWTGIGIYPQSAPAMGAGQVGSALADGDWATVVCEAQGQPVGNGQNVIDIWDRLDNGAWLPNAFLKTSADGWTPGVPKCSDLLKKADSPVQDRAATPSAVTSGVNSPCGDYVQSVSWIERDGVKSLSVVPTECGRNNAFAHVQESFDEMYHKAKLNWGGDTYWSAHNQWQCHADFWWVTDKTEWNIEPSRPNVGFWNTVFAHPHCNP